MLLAIDCGNTNTIFSIWDGTKFLSTWRTATDHQRTADQYFVWLSTLMSLQNIKADITDVIISSTVPDNSPPSICRLKIELVEHTIAQANASILSP